MAKQILKDYLSDIDRLKDGITEESEKILQAVDLKDLLSMDTIQKKEYLTSVLMDFWEAQENVINDAILLGEKKAEMLINASK